MEQIQKAAFYIRDYYFERVTLDINNKPNGDELSVSFQTSGEFNKQNNSFNLIDNYEHLEFLEELNLAVKAKRRKPVYIPQLIELLKRQGLFKYDAIRAPSLEAISDPLYVKYKPKHKARIFLRPLNQVCFIKKKNRLNLRDYKIVYPSHYVEGYVI